MSLERTSMSATAEVVKQVNSTVENPKIMVAKEENRTVFGAPGAGKTVFQTKSLLKNYLLD